MRTVLALALVLFALPAFAEDDSKIFASDLGRLIGSEKGCSLTFSQDAVAALVQTSAKPDDLEFLSYLEAGAASGQRHVEEMSATLKAAYCAQARKLADHYKLLD